MLFFSWPKGREIHRSHGDDGPHLLVDVWGLREELVAGTESTVGSWSCLEMASLKTSSGAWIQAEGYMKLPMRPRFPTSGEPWGMQSADLLVKGSTDEWHQWPGRGSWHFQTELWKSHRVPSTPCDSEEQTQEQLWFTGRRDTNKHV